MLLTNLYYRLKPLVPRSIRLRIRRSLALRTLQRVQDTWPIMPGSERPPEGWPGWPDGQKFAFVLTHDVESAAGLSRVRQLAELEMELGFRSSFNFVPEGDYTVPPALRVWLTDRGFEIGVHDLHHDGKLYSDKKSFLSKAQRINHYLTEWNAVGFRSAFMLHNYEWLHALNVLYEASSFDTDPFEPQPDGVNTIFPFWIPRGSEVGGQMSGFDPINHQPSAINHPRSGYIELPYTLPQDSTLFVLLREKTNRIWEQKLDWIAANRGMALLNVHPDYIQLDDAAASKHTYPVRFFTQLLHYVTSNYGDSVWHALPSEVAAFVAPRQSDGAPSCSAVFAEEPTTPAVDPRNSPTQHAFARI